jgi:hypothetical protein
VLKSAFSFSPEVGRGPPDHLVGHSIYSLKGDKMNYISKKKELNGAIDGPGALHFIFTLPGPFPFKALCQLPLFYQSFCTHVLVFPLP